MSLAQIVLDSVNAAKKSLGDLVITPTLKEITTTGFDRTTGTPTTTILSKTLSGVIDVWDALEVDGTLIRYDDIKFIAFPGADINQDDEITIGSVTYTVIKVRPIKAGSLTVLRIVQLRQ
jgi:formylmethanofuran dehydrogenase subunit B